jgi:hypothetical protein
MAFFSLGFVMKKDLTHALLTPSILLAFSMLSVAPVIAQSPAVPDKAPPPPEKKAELTKATASVVNQVPGVKVAPSDLEAPQSAPIKGFHPIKRLLQPIENLEGSSIKLEQQMVKLEGPIAAMHPPMVGIKNKMSDVNGTMNKMQDQVHGVDAQMKGVRSDLAKMHTEVSNLKGPILAIQRPLADVEGPLARVKRQLNYVLIAIILATFGVVFGTPVAAVLVYRYKDKLFPAKVANALPENKTMATSGSTTP